MRVLLAEKRRERWLHHISGPYPVNLTYRRQPKRATCSACDLESALIDRHVLQVSGSVVTQERPDEDVVGGLLQDFGRPARHAPDSEDRHKKVLRDAKQVVDTTGEEIDVDINAVTLVASHLLLDGFQDLVPLLLAHTL